MSERVLGDLRDWYDMPGCSTLRHVVIDSAGQDRRAVDVAAVTAAYRAAVNALLEEHGLSIDEHDRLVVDCGWIDGEEIRELVDEALDEALERRLGGPDRRGAPA